MDTLGLAAAESALQARAREFARAVVRPRAAQIDATEEYPWDIVKALTDAKFVGMTIPTEYGGAGGPFLGAGLGIAGEGNSCTVTAPHVGGDHMGGVSAPTVP